MTTEITRYNNMCGETKQTLESQIEVLLQIVFVLLSETPGNNNGLNSTAINLLKYIHETTNVNIDPIVRQIQQFIGTQHHKKIQNGGQKGFLYYMLRLILIMSLLFSLILAQLTVSSKSMEPTVLATQSMRSLIPDFVQSFMNSNGSCALLVALLASSKYSFANIIESFQQYQLNKINTGDVTKSTVGMYMPTVKIRDFNQVSLLSNSNSSLAYGKLTKSVFEDKIVEQLEFKRPHPEGNNDMILLTKINEAITQRATSALRYVSNNKPGYIKGDVLFLEFGIPGHRETLIVRTGEDGITRWGIWETNTIENMATYNAETQPYIVPPNFWDNEQEEQKKISIITDSPLKEILFDWLKALGPKSPQIPSTLYFNIEMVRNDKTPVQESLPLTNYITAYHVDRVQEVIQNIVELKKDFLRRNLLGFTMYPVKFVNPIGTTVKIKKQLYTEPVTEAELQLLSNMFQKFSLGATDGFERRQLELFNSEIAGFFERGFEEGKGLRPTAEMLLHQIQSFYKYHYKSGTLNPIGPENNYGGKVVKTRRNKHFKKRKSTKKTKQKQKSRKNN